MVRRQVIGTVAFGLLLGVLVGCGDTKPTPQTAPVPQTGTTDITKTKAHAKPSVDAVTAPK